MRTRDEIKALAGLLRGGNERGFLYSLTRILAAHEERLPPDQPKADGNTWPKRKGESLWKCRACVPLHFKSCPPWELPGKCSACGCENWELARSAGDERQPAPQEAPSGDVCSRCLKPDCGGGCGEAPANSWECELWVVIDRGDPLRDMDGSPKLWTAKPLAENVAVHVGGTVREARPGERTALGEPKKQSPAPSKCPGGHDCEGKCVAPATVKESLTAENVAPKMRRLNAFVDANLGGDDAAGALRAARQDFADELAAAREADRERIADQQEELHRFAKRIDELEANLAKAVEETRREGEMRERTVEGELAYKRRLDELEAKLAARVETRSTKWQVREG